MRTVNRRIDVAEAVACGEPVELAVEVCLPPAGTAASGLVYCCLPGGGMNAGYFDLRAGDDTSFSFAEQMTARGAIVVLVNPVAIGGSTIPAAGFAVGVDAIVAANAHAVAEMLAALREGTMDPSLPSLPALKAIGVGHSMGGMLTVLQQARDAVYAGLVLMGFSLNGLADLLSDDERTVVGDGAAARARIGELAQARFGEPFLMLPPSDLSRSMLARGRKDPRVGNAIAARRDRVIAVTALFSMIPDSIAPEAAAVTVPLLLLFGDHDICGAPHRVPASFPGVSDLTLCVLPDTGHNHFTAESRGRLFGRVAAWADCLSTGPA
jgi:pimeloyl-ACP methyl ester carboxylesterase